MTADFLLLAAWLLTRLTMRILAITRQMTGLEAVVRAALELLPAHFAAANISQPARLMLESLLTAHTPLLHKMRAFGASFIVLMAVVSYLWVSTCLRSIARIPTWRRFSAARQGWLENSSSTTAAELLEYRFSTGATGSAMA